MSAIGTTLVITVLYLARQLGAVFRVSGRRSWTGTVASASCLAIRSPSRLPGYGRARGLSGPLADHDLRCHKLLPLALGARPGRAGGENYLDTTVCGR